MWYREDRLATFHIGELRAELAGTAHGPLKHTELRDWLRG